MARGTKTTDFLKECMADALLKLMKDKDIDKVTVTEITSLAGVGRSTWFRHFTTKSEALTFKLVALWRRWSEERNIAERQRFNLENSRDFFHIQLQQPQSAENALRHGTANLHI